MKSSSILKPMHKLLLFVLFLFGFSILNAQKIGYTNIELILAYMPESKLVESQLDAFSSTLEKEIKQRSESYQASLNDYISKKEANKLTEPEEQKLIAELQDAEKEINNMTQRAESNLLKKQEELMQPIILKIQQAIDAIAIEKGFAFILNQTTGLNILYGLQSLDITTDLAQKLGIVIPE